MIMIVKTPESQMGSPAAFRTVRPEHTVRAAINVVFEGFTHTKVMLTLDQIHC